jgi:hypothetical protein
MMKWKVFQEVFFNLIQLPYQLPYFYWQGGKIKLITTFFCLDPQDNDERDGVPGVVFQLDFAFLPTDIFRLVV